MPTLLAQTPTVLADLEAALAVVGARNSGDVVHTLRAVGHLDLGRRLQQLSTGRDLLVHPDTILVQDLRKALRGQSGDCNNCNKDAHDEALFDPIENIRTKDHVAESPSSEALGEPSLLVDSAIKTVANTVPDN
jgi:hypothetical protein